jgi:hypothetical protein
MVGKPPATVPLKAIKYYATVPFKGKKSNNPQDQKCHMGWPKLQWVEVSHYDKPSIFCEVLEWTNPLSTLA